MYTPSPEEISEEIEVYDIYKEAFLMYQHGVITKNEALLKAGFTPIPSGDKFIDETSHLTNIEPLNSI